MPVIAEDCYEAAPDGTPPPTGIGTGTIVMSNTNGQAYQLGALINTPSNYCIDPAKVPIDCVGPPYAGCTIIDGGSVDGACGTSFHVLTARVYNATLVTTPSQQCVDLCSNNEKDDGEIGIDCGGSCSAECELQCPEDYQVYYPVEGPPQCVKIQMPDPYGNCPSGFQIEYWGENNDQKRCVRKIDPILGAPQTPQPTDLGGGGWGGGGGLPPEGVGKKRTPPEPEPIKPTAPEGTGSNCTETETDITYDPKSGITYTKTTKTTKYYSGTNCDGQYLGESEYTDTTATPGKPTEPTGPSQPMPNPDDPSQYNFNPTLDDEGNILPGDYGAEPDWSTLRQDIKPIVDNVKNAILATTINTSNASCTLTLMTYKGKSITINLCPYENTLLVMGGFILTFAYISGFIFYVDRG